MKLLSVLASLGNCVLIIFAIYVFATFNTRDGEAMLLLSFIATGVLNIYLIVAYKIINEKFSDSFIFLYFKRKKLEQIARIKELEDQTKSPSK